jgi:hypothetical protein
MSFRVFAVGGLALLMGRCLTVPNVRAIVLPSPVVLSRPVTVGAEQGPASRHQDSEHGTPKNRLIVLTDIGAEADDTESTVRLLLYSDVIDIQGLIATTSIWRPSPQPDLIREVIRAYGKVHGNLVKHDPAFPPADALQSLVKTGVAEYGMKGVGENKDSEGSEWIIRTLEQNDDRPLWITVWGGPNTLAQALYKLRATRTPRELNRLIAKLRVYTISDQDDSGPWIRKNFPGLFYIVSPGGDYGASTWQGINIVVPGIDNSSISNEWLAKHIQQGHGPLGAAYPDVAYGMEGDTPSWLGLIPNGLNDMKHPDWGSWGGTSCINPLSPSPMQRRSSEEFPSHRRRAPSGPIPLIATHPRFTENTGVRSMRVISRSRTVKQRYGGGEMTSRTILPRAWSGRQNLIAKPITLLSSQWINPTPSPFHPECTSGSAPMRPTLMEIA